jgi:hypothetical protein
MRAGREMRRDHFIKMINLIDLSALFVSGKSDVSMQHN